MNFVGYKSRILPCENLTSRSVPGRKYALLRGESITDRNAVARKGPISIGPSPRACNRNLIPLVLATRSISIITAKKFHCNSKANREREAYEFQLEFECKQVGMGPPHAQRQ